MSKKRSQKRIILLYCEWENEKTCATYFKCRYSSNIRIMDGHGGSPKRTVELAIQEKEWFDKIFVWIDTDRPEFSVAEDLAKKYNVCLIKNNQNLEKEINKVIRKNKRSKKMKLELNESLFYERIFNWLTEKEIKKFWEPFYKLIEIFK